MSFWGAPPDVAAWVALFLGLLSVPLGLNSERTRKYLLAPSNRLFLGACCAMSCVLSALYVKFYLEGGPRIIDATAYYLQASYYAQGKLALDVPEPISAFTGRFLLPTADERLSVLFPPGYPLALALGFLAGAPMLLGPVLAALITTLTYSLSKAVFGQELPARLAALLSMLCTSLRYHTADTMSHGLCAALLCGCLLCALSQRRFSWVLGGLLLGWLFATRPVSAVSAGVMLVLLVALTSDLKTACWKLLHFSSCLVGIGLFLWQQAQITGAWFEPTQYAYYSLADGPPGCFEFGLGDTRGCRVEHADFVKRYLPNGYHLKQALLTTGRRLAMHLPDAANLDIGLPLVGLAMWQTWQNKRARALSLGCLLHIALLSGFYFDGNYPGGGARMFAELLPLEHLLLGQLLFERRWFGWLLPVTLCGFALRSSHGAEHLKTREGGLPMFQKQVLAQADVTEGLLFLDTDHGFNLAAAEFPVSAANVASTSNPPSSVSRPGNGDASKSPPTHSLTVARLKQDGSDYAIWSARGRPPSYRYRFEPLFTRGKKTLPRVIPYQPRDSGRMEFEKQWPPEWLSDGWVEPRQLATQCGLINGVTLHALSPHDTDSPTATPPHPQIGIELWADRDGTGYLDLRGVVTRTNADVRTMANPVVRLQPATLPLKGEWKVGYCGVWESEPFRVERGPVRLKLEFVESTHLDSAELVIR